MHQDEDPAEKNDGKPGNARRDGWEKFLKWSVSS